MIERLDEASLIWRIADCLIEAMGTDPMIAARDLGPYAPLLQEERFCSRHERTANASPAMVGSHYECGDPTQATVTVKQIQRVQSSDAANDS